MTLRYTYTLFAPVYDAFVAPFTAKMRQDSLRRLREGPHADVLLVGVGSGLDLPLLPQGPRYTGLDLTPAMLARARRKAAVSRHAADVHRPGQLMPAGGTAAYCCCGRIRALTLWSAWRRVSAAASTPSAAAFSAPTW